jgi:hypothetical protein
MILRVKQKLANRPFQWRRIVQFWTGIEFKFIVESVCYKMKIMFKHITPLIYGLRLFLLKNEPI